MMYDVWQNEPFQVAPEDLDALYARLGGHFEQRGKSCFVRRVVGHLTLPSTNVLRIRSRKADAASILAWMAYADPSCRALSLFRSVPDAIGGGGIVELLARLFVGELLRAAYCSGLVRAYRRCEVVTSNVRGRIDFAKLSRQGGDLSRLPCDVWERLTETALNRFLAAALRAIEVDALLSNAARDILPGALSLMAGVRPAVGPRFLSENGQLDRNEQHFALAVALARLLLQSVGLGEGTAWESPSFLFNLETLFEATVAKAFRDASIEVEAKSPAHYAINVGPDKQLSRTMSLDLLVRGMADGPVVVDAKYKMDLSSANIQQVTTYCVMVGATRAVLVFPMGYPEHIPSGSSIAVRGAGRWADRQVRVDVVTLRTDGKNVAAWRKAGCELVEAVLGSGDAPAGYCV